MPRSDNLEVLVQHPVAEQVIRSLIIHALIPHVKGIEGNEFNILQSASQKAHELQKLVIDFIQDDFPVLDMNSY